MGATKFSERVLGAVSGPLQAIGIKSIQVNIGYRCNMACKHCHIAAGPERTENMEGKTVDTVLRVISENPIETLDVTGGAPELNPHFRYLVTEARKLGRHVIARTNLTIFFEKGKDDLPEFYRDNDVELIASLPYYMKDNVDRVRGSGTFRKSIETLRMLNRLGYGEQGGKLLNLVYNPQGGFLSPPQAALEEEYKRELEKRHGVFFNRLYTFTNMPIGRFREFLVRSGNLEKYYQKLACAFNPGTLDAVMCRHLISVGWNGTLFDCDFNQIAGLAVDSDCPRNISDFDYAALSVRRIMVDDHCYGCTAGQGST